MISQPARAFRITAWFSRLFKACARTWDELTSSTTARDEEIWNSYVKTTRIEGRIYAYLNRMLMDGAITHDGRFRMGQSVAGLDIIVYRGFKHIQIYIPESNRLVLFVSGSGAVYSGRLDDLEHTVACMERFYVLDDLAAIYDE